MKVQLSRYEIDTAASVGLRRNLEAIHSKRHAAFPEQTVGELFGFHILAAMAELAVAKHLGLYWGGHFDKFSCGDVGPYEVRYSRNGNLKVRQRDEGIVISVTGYPPEFDIRGWIYAETVRETIRPTRPRANGPPAYFIANSLLNPIETLPELSGP